jgi:hypothetical protein
VKKHALEDEDYAKAAEADLESEIAHAKPHAVPTTNDGKIE